MKNLLHSKHAMALGAVGVVIFPSLCGIAVHFSLNDIAIGLAVSAGASAVIGMLGYLTIPSEPGEFQQVDLRAAAGRRS